MAAGIYRSRLVLAVPSVFSLSNHLNREWDTENTEDAAGSAGPTGVPDWSSRLEFLAPSE